MRFLASGVLSYRHAFHNRSAFYGLVLLTSPMLAHHRHSTAVNIVVVAAFNCRLTSILDLLLHVLDLRGRGGDRREKSAMSPQRHLMSAGVWPY